MISKLLGWASDIKKRHIAIESFNSDAKIKYVDKETEFLLIAKTSIGCSEFKHALSKNFASGFNINVMGSIPYDADTIKSIGRNIMTQESLIRKLISLGWDTLEIQDTESKFCFKWQLK